MNKKKVSEKYLIIEKELNKLQYWIKCNYHTIIFQQYSKLYNYITIFNSNTTNNFRNKNGFNIGEIHNKLNYNRKIEFIMYWIDNNQHILFN
tara:strand:+ start:2189 stop:2464 length:276 start_codon:yes stop_codon:yes gene_type:complete